MTDTPERQRAPKAQGMALTQLTHRHWDRYQQLYQQERDIGGLRRPQSRAKIKLSHEYRDEYRELYDQARQEILEGQAPAPGRPGVWTRGNTAKP